MDFRIGVILEALKLPVREAIVTARKLGAEGVQMYCTVGEYAPENMTADKKKELLSIMNDNGLVFSAICGDLKKGFFNKELNPELIEKSKRILELAKELGTDIVTTHIGSIPENPNNDSYKIMQEACFKLSGFADDIGSHFAIETGSEKAETLRCFLDTLGSSGVAVNLDPANLVMLTDDDPVKAVDTLAPYIVHTHAKDGLRLSRCSHEKLLSLGVIPDQTRGLEVSMGDGHVDWNAYLSALDRIGYRSFLTIERKIDEDPVGEIRKEIDFLRKLVY